MFRLPQNTILGKLELEHIFEFYDIPRLFTCKNKSGSKYLAVSTYDNDDQYEWLYVSVSDDRLRYISSQQFSLHEAFSRPEDGFLFKVECNFEGDSTVSHLFPEQIGAEDLPLEDSFLPIIKVNNLNSVGLGEIEPRAAAISSQRETYNLHLYPKNDHLPEINSRKLGRIMVTTQDLLDALGQACENQQTITGAIPAAILDQTRINTCQIFNGSFGMQFKAEKISDLFGNSLISDALQQLSNLLSTEDDEDRISNILHTLKNRVASKYRRFLKELLELNTSLTFDWGSPNESRGTTFFMKDTVISKAFAIVDKVDIEMSEEVFITGRLKGMNVKTKHYHIETIENNEKYSGRVIDTAIPEVEHATINNIYRAKLKKVIETKSSSGGERIKWVLTGLTPITPSSQ
jgi:hypothetical protein